MANAIRYASRFADILSCSWSGPESPDIELALEEAGEGRNGRGCAVFCATGNENAKVSYPARSPFAIAVGATTDKERLASYSNHGPQVSVTAPSSGDTANKSIFTTDVSITNRGFNTGADNLGGADGLHTNDFGGTSSATPLAAGVAALVLAANPDLTRDEVRSILEATADKVGPKSSYDSKGHSKDFGFGRVNAVKAVKQALKLAAAKTKRKELGCQEETKGRRRQESGGTQDGHPSSQAALVSRFRSSSHVAAAAAASRPAGAECEERRGAHSSAGRSQRAGVGGRLVGALQEGQQRGVGIGGGAHRVVGQQELAQALVVEGRAGGSTAAARKPCGSG